MNAQNLIISAGIHLILDVNSLKSGESTKTWEKSFRPQKSGQNGFVFNLDLGLNLFLMLCVNFIFSRFFTKGLPLFSSCVLLDLLCFLEFWMIYLCVKLFKGEVVFPMVLFSALSSSSIFK